MVFKSLSSVPSEIIFLDQERYEEPGFEESSSTNPDKDGLLVEYPGFDIYLGDEYVALPRQFCLRINDVGYSADVHEAGSKTFPTKALRDSLAIVVQRSIWSKPPTCLGVLVTRQYDEDEYHFRAQHEALVKLTRLQSIRSGISSEIPTFSTAFIEGPGPAKDPTKHLQRHMCWYIRKKF